MAVPKRKTTKSRRNMRRSHHALGRVNVIIDPITGDYKLPHQINTDGTYNGRQVVISNNNNAVADETAPETL
jgi:large subunit ribosomal protein L32